MKKIMIIDDEIEILDILDSFLSKNFTVETFNNPLNALDASKSGSYDLVLTDIMMPGYDGFEILETLKQNNVSIKVILMTAYDTMHKQNLSKELNADGYIKKPFESLKTVENTLISVLNL